MEREFVAQRTANKLREAEAVVDEAIRKASELLAEVYGAKKELGLASTAIVEEAAAIGRAVAALQTAHGELASSHHGLAVVARFLGLRVTGLGYKPSKTARLEEVDRAAA